MVFASNGTDVHEFEKIIRDVSYELAMSNYNEVLRDVAVGEPVFLTENGKGRYAVVDIAEYEKTQATIKLLKEIAKGQKSGEEKGWLSYEEVREHFKDKTYE